MEKTIYLVTHSDYDEHSVLAAFSKRALAESHMAEASKVREYGVDIEEFVIDAEVGYRAVKTYAMRRYDQDVPQRSAYRPKPEMHLWPPGAVAMVMHILGHQPPHNYVEAWSSVSHEHAAKLAECELQRIKQTPPAEQHAQRYLTEAEVAELLGASSGE